LLDLLHLRGEDLGFVLEGSDLAQLFPIIGVPLPPAAVSVERASESHRPCRSAQVRGRWGSDLSGISVDLSQKPQYIKADLVSHRLDMADLGGLVGAGRGEARASPKPPPEGRVLPQEPYNLEKLRVANADVRFRGESVLTEKLPLEKMVATLKLRDGVLTLAPLGFGVAGGNLDLANPHGRTPAGDRHWADIAVKQLHLEKLFPASLSRANAGVITARPARHGRQLPGEDARQWRRRCGPDDGRRLGERALVRLLNLDVANAIPVLLTGDRRCRCDAWSSASEAHGIRCPHALVLDTGKAIITGTGAINSARSRWI
jgi:hypothetical protein